jgi:hypothetical protein
MGNHHFGENLMPDPTDKRIEELWQYIPPYTAPNHPPQVKVITTTNTGDTPMNEEDPDLLAGKNLDELRGRKMYIPMSECWEETENAKYQNNLLAQRCRELEQERDEARREVCQMVSDSDESSKPESIEQVASRRGWDCYNTPEAKTIKTLNGIVTDGGKAVPPKYEDLEDD